MAFVLEPNINVITPCKTFKFFYISAEPVGLLQQSNVWVSVVETLVVGTIACIVVRPA